MTDHPSEQAHDWMRTMMPCLYCKKLVAVRNGGLEEQGVCNVFCPDSDCEDLYAASL